MIIRIVQFLDKYKMAFLDTNILNLFMRFT